MKKYIAIILTALIMTAVVQAQSLTREYHDDAGPNAEDLSIEVWVDNEDGIYYMGDVVQIFFQADRDCYAAIYSVDTRGEVNMLFPEDPYDDGRIEAGEVYSIPGRYADFDLVVSGPEGIEHIQAVASVERMEIPDWYSGKTLFKDDREDPEDFIEEINYRYFDCRYNDCFKAYDHTSIYVKSAHYYYKPVYVPQNWYDSPDYSVIYIDYPYGGEVYIDGIYFGIAPLWIPRIMLGWHWFTIYDRYGYCWEHNYHVRHFRDHRPHYFDHSIVRTSRSKTSRYTDIRSQAKKYRKSDYRLSEKQVKTSRATDIRQKSKTFARPGSSKYKSDYNKKSTSSYKTKSKDRSSLREGRKSSSTAKTRKSANKWDSWNSKKSGSSKSSLSGNSRTTKRSSDSKSTVKRSSGSSKKSSSGTKSSTKKSSMSSGSKKSGSTTKSSGGYKSSGGSSSKSSGSSTKSSSGSKSSSSHSKGGVKKR